MRVSSIERLGLINAGAVPGLQRSALTVEVASRRNYESVSEAYRPLLPALSQR
jgi:hypothetical protein